MTTPASPRVRAEWANRVRAEYGSAALTARVVCGLIACGMPRDLVDAALRITADELDHAELSHAALTALGGDPDAVDIDVGRLAGPPDPGPPLAALTEAILGAFCVGETVAVPLFAAMREGATHPAAAAALDRILRDEATHRAVGWAARDALLALDPAGVRAVAAARLGRLIGAVRRAYVLDAAAVPLTPDERAAGLLDLDDYARIFEDCLQAVILPRFARQGIAPAP